MKRFLCIFFVFILMFSVACAPENQNQTPSTPPSQEGEGGGSFIEPDTTPEVDGEKYVVKNGETDYAILIPDNAGTAVQAAAAEFQLFFSQATGITLPVKRNAQYSSTEKYVSIGDTQVATSVTIDKAALKSQGFRIKTVGDNIVVKGGGDYGCLWGAYELLTRMFNYEYFAKDAHYIDKNVTEYKLKDYDITDKPDIETRACADSQGYTNLEVSRRMRQIQPYTEFLIPMDNAYHNSFYYVMDGKDENGKPIVPEKYLGNCLTQLCYTGNGDDDVLEEMLNKSLDYLVKHMLLTDKNDVIFGLQDQNGWCNCDACTKVIGQYGAKSATMILFINKLRDKLDAYLEANSIDRDITIYWVAYFDIVSPPVKEVNGEYVPTAPEMMCKPGVGIDFAPINANYTLSVYDSVNSPTLKQFKAYNVLTDKLFVWTYACNFYDFFMPYDSITYMQDWVKEIVENDGTYWFNQGRHSQGSSSQFDLLRQYLVSKLGWDADADVAKLTDKFFDGYFGVAKEPMRKFYDELRSVMRYNFDILGMGTGVTSYSNGPSYWPEQTLNNWMNYVEEAYELAGDNEELRTRILRESIFVRYHLLKYHWTGNDNIKELQKEFISDAMKCGIEKMSEHVAIAETFNS